jgi:hypothetical protein
MTYVRPVSPVGMTVTLNMRTAFPLNSIPVEGHFKRTSTMMNVFPRDAVVSPTLCVGILHDSSRPACMSGVVGYRSTESQR